jgi:hypothetical protein
MLCGSHFCPFSPISQVEQWPQAKGAATYQGKCLTRLLSAPTELEAIRAVARSPLNVSRFP